VDKVQQLSKHNKCKINSVTEKEIFETCANKNQQNCNLSWTIMRQLIPKHGIFQKQLILICFCYEYNGSIPLSRKLSTAPSPETVNPVYSFKTCISKLYFNTYTHLRFGLITYDF